MEDLYFGIDIGGTAVKIGLFGKDGSLISKCERSTRAADNSVIPLSEIADFLKQMLTPENRTLKDIAGIGIGVPGIILGHSFAKRAVNLGWENRDIKAEMQELTGIQNIFVENDAKAAALGEWWKGGHEQCRSAVMITIGTGVGGGVVLNGEIIPGAFGSAGELGHIQVDPDETEPCACGKFGHLEQYASATGIVRTFKKRLLETGHPSVLRDREVITAKDIFDAAKNGDVTAQEAIGKAVKMIARTMSAVSAIFDPELFLIGGGVSKAGDFLLDAIREEYRKTVIFSSEEARIEAALLGNDAGMYGAVKMVLPHKQDQAFFTGSCSI